MRQYKEVTDDTKTATFGHRCPPWEFPCRVNPSIISGRSFYKLALRTPKQGSPAGKDLLYADLSQHELSTEGALHFHQSDSG